MHFVQEILLVENKKNFNVQIKVLNRCLSVCMLPNAGLLYPAVKRLFFTDSNEDEF